MTLERHEMYSFASTLEQEELMTLERHEMHPNAGTLEQEAVYFFFLYAQSAAKGFSYMYNASIKSKIPQIIPL